MITGIIFIIFIVIIIIMFIIIITVLLLFPLSLTMDFYVLPILVRYVFFPQSSPARLQILHPLFKNCLVFVTKQSFSLGFLESLYFWLKFSLWIL